MLLPNPRLTEKTHILLALSLSSEHLLQRAIAPVQEGSRIWVDFSRNGLPKPLLRLIYQDPHPDHPQQLQQAAFVYQD